MTQAKGLPTPEDRDGWNRSFDKLEKMFSK
jgi:hypothetical protein